MPTQHTNTYTHTHMNMRRTLIAQQRAHARSLQRLYILILSIFEGMLHCITLHDTASHCITLHHTASHCNTLHHTASHCNTLQHTATHCNTLQHTATHCNTLPRMNTTYSYQYSYKYNILTVTQPTSFFFNRRRISWHNSEHTPKIRRVCSMQRMTCSLAHASLFLRRSRLCVCLY